MSEDSTMPRKYRLSADARILLTRLARGDEVMVMQHADAGRSLEKRGLVTSAFGTGDNKNYLCWLITDEGREAIRTSQLGG